MEIPSERTRSVLDSPALDRLIERIRGAGYRVAGPRVIDGVLGLDEIGPSESLPRGFGDEQGNGRYRLTRNGGAGLFGCAVGPHSWKKFLTPARRLLFSAEKDEKGLRTSGPAPDPSRWAFIGVRPCDIAAIHLRDKVFLGSGAVDEAYRAIRERCLIVVVQCTAPSGTCFCASMGTGPRADGGFDLSLTELADGRLLAEAGTAGGEELLLAASPGRATAGDLAGAAEAIASAARQMGRTLEREGLREVLLQNAESSRWEEIATRCLACGNCTMVCPTCFCSTVEDTSNLSGSRAEHWQRWDSCFTLDFSYIHGGSVRRTVGARYRQWMTHKLATWVDQFGEPGCVGCGRCITWCPAGIDLTEEARTFRQSAARSDVPI